MAVPRPVQLNCGPLRSRYRGQTQTASIHNPQAQSYEMAADSRDPGQVAPSAESQSPPNETKHEFPKSQVGKLWDEFGNPKEPINLMPGGTYNSAGGKPKEITFMSYIKSLSMSDFTSFYKAPCARESLMAGIGTGFGVGGLRAVLGGKPASLPNSYQTPSSLLTNHRDEISLGCQ